MKAGAKHWRNDCSRAPAQEHVTAEKKWCYIKVSYSELESLNFKRWKKGKETNTFWLKLILAGVPSSQPCKSLVAKLSTTQTHPKTLQASFYQNHWWAKPDTCLHFMPWKLPQMFWIASWSLEVLIFSGHLLSNCMPIICCVLVTSALDFENNFACREICCCCRPKNTKKA